MYNQLMEARNGNGLNPMTEDEIKKFDKENTEIFSDLAIESADETRNTKTIANTYFETAQNYRYIGETAKALQTYSALAKNPSMQDDYDTMAKNYLEASYLMEEKGNKKKAYTLMLKSREFARLAREQKALEDVA